MAHGNLKLISARIDEETYNKISALAEKHYYWNKNHIIRMILLNVLREYDEQQLFELIQRRPWE